MNKTGDLKNVMTILIGDKNDIIREKLAGAISRIDSVACVLQCRDILFIERFLSQCLPDVILLDIEMSRAAVSIIKSVKQFCPDQKILVYSDSLLERQMPAIHDFVKELGADDYIPTTEVLQKICDIEAGRDIEESKISLH